jgi:hypothetical protein
MSRRASILCGAFVLAACGGSDVAPQPSQAQSSTDDLYPGSAPSGGTFSGSTGVAQSFSGETAPTSVFAGSTVPAGRNFDGVVPFASFSGSVTQAPSGSGGACDLSALCEQIRAVCPPNLDPECGDAYQSCRQAVELAGRDAAVAAQICAELDCLIGCGQDEDCLDGCD